MRAEVLTEDVVRTDRLTLTRPRPQDRSALTELVERQRDELGTVTQAGEPASQVVDTWLQTWEATGTGVAVVRRRGSAHIEGFAGCVLDDVRPSTGANWRLTCYLVPEARGAGIGTEAAWASIARARQAKAGIAIVTEVRRSDAAAAALARRMGLSRIAEHAARGVQIYGDYASDASRWGSGAGLTEQRHSEGISRESAA